jgi:parvulin-like peptidyl-prolyl isomerase
MKKRFRPRYAALFVITAFGSAGCLEPFPPPKSATSKPAKAKTATTESDQQGKAVLPRALQKAPTPSDGYLAGAHILISYQGAQRSKATRSEAEALQLAKKIAAELGTPVTKVAFAAAAKKHSDGPSGPRGGSLGTWKKGRMVPAFDAAIVKLPYGGVTREPIKTAFGYHLIRREKPLPDVQISAAHILVSYRGATRAPAGVTRDRAAADARCKKVAAQAAKGGPKAFAKLAKQFSDAPDKARGGRMGSWNARSFTVPAAINQTLLALAVGKSSKPIYTSFGCHILMRLPLPPIFAGSHILIAYSGAKRSKASINRSKADALGKAQRLIAKLGKISDASARATEFAVLAGRHSDGPSASRGGHLGSWPKGRMVPAFDAAIEQLKIGEITKTPVETPFGYHIILRTKPKKKVP